MADIDTTVSNLDTRTKELIEYAEKKQKEEETKCQEELSKIVEETERKKREDDEEVAFQLLLRLSAEELEINKAKKYVSENDEELALKMQLEESRALALYSQIRALEVRNQHPPTMIEKGGSLSLYSQILIKKEEKEKPGWSPASTYYPAAVSTVSAPSISSNSSSKPMSANAAPFVPKKKEEKETVGCLDAIKAVVHYSYPLPSVSTSSTPLVSPRNNTASETSSITSEKTPLIDKEKTD